jgi:hypothetical protein
VNCITFHGIPFHHQKEKNRTTLSNGNKMTR